jgi:mediator of RNA polymerase II transcription subunit 13
MPSVTAFWDTLGLSPSHGPKHIKALCVFPENRISADKVLYFMEALHRTWSRDRLGSQEMLQIPAISEGLIPVHTSASSLDSAEGFFTEDFLDLDNGQ